MSSQSTEATGDALVLTGGHRLDYDALFAMMSAVCEPMGWRWAHAHQPSAQSWLGGDAVRRWNAVLCHDIPGLVLRRGSPPEPTAVSPAIQRSLRDMLSAGLGFVMTHHSLAGWPAWDGWAEVMGGRFHYAPGRLRGIDWPSSGTRITHYTARIADPRHPVCAGLEDFALTDELYCCPVFEDDVVPLIRTDADMSGRLFTSTYEHVVFGEEAAPDCGLHPPASDLIVWATAIERSPVVYIQPGDSAATFGNEQYRRLVANALTWVSSPDAHAWAASLRRRLVINDDQSPDA
jgi:type 1 glutamine amidotransferase